MPEPSGPTDERFTYTLTRARKEALAAALRADEERRARRNAWVRQARATRRRPGTVCGRWRENEHVPELRMSRAWLRAAGFDLGQEFEAGVEGGRLMIWAV